MRVGDLIKFKYSGSQGEEWKIGLLKEWRIEGKVAIIIFEGKERRLSTSLTAPHKEDKRT